MSKNCIITTVKSKIKGNATSFIEKESEIFIPVSKKFTLNQTRAMAQDKVNKINKEYLSEKFGEVVSLNSSYTDGTGINIHPSQRLVDAYEVKEGNKTIEEVNTHSNRDINYFNEEQALLEQDEDDRELKVQKELDKIVEDINNTEFDENGQGLLFDNLQNKELSLLQVEDSSLNQNDSVISKQKEQIKELQNLDPYYNKFTDEQIQGFINSVFPDSKVKNIVYHGSSEKIEDFDKTKLGKLTNASSAKEGFFFSSNIETAKSYAVPKNLNETPEGRKIIEDFDISKISEEEEIEFGLKSMYKQQLSEHENDFDFDSIEYKEGERKFKGWKTGTTYTTFSKIYISILNIQNPLIVDYKSNPYREISYFENLISAKKENKDGAILKNTFDGRERWNAFETDVLTVFEPEQIFILNSDKAHKQIEDFVNNKKRKIETNEFRNTESNDFIETEQNNKHLQQEIKKSGGNLLWTSSEGYRYSVNSLQELRNFTEKDAKSSDFKKENDRMGSISFRLSSNSSNFDKYLQSSYEEIWKEASEINNLEANIVASTFIAQQISEPTHKFYGRLLSRIRESFGVQANGNISLEDDTAYFYVDDRNSISINLYRIGQYISKFKSFNGFQKDLENTLNEESIHLAINNLATEEEMKQVFDEMTPSQIKSVKEIYTNIKSVRKEDDKINLAHEFIRMIIQNKYTGEITESSNPTLLGIINRLLNKVKEWLGTEAIKTNEILNRFDNLINKPQFNISEKTTNQDVIEGFLLDFGINVEEYNSIEDELGIDALSASDLITKSIAYQKGESVLPEVAYFAYSMLGKQNNKLRSELRYLINKWDKYQERFDYHVNIIKQKEGFIKDSKEWKNKIRDLVIIDFLTNNLQNYYLNNKEFIKVLDSKWTKEDFSLWNKIISMIENFLSKFSDKYFNHKQKLENIGISIANEVMDRNYEYFDYSLGQEQIQKYYKNTIESDSFAKELIEFNQQNLGLILTGSLALRKAGSVYRTSDETLHDIDWVVPYELTNTEENKKALANIRSYQGADRSASAKMALSYIEDLSWFKKFKKKYPSYIIINGFYGGEHNAYESLTIQGVIDGEFYKEDGYHEEEKSFYKKDPVTKKAIRVKEIQKVKHQKGDWIKNTGYVIDFFARLQPHQEQHENYFKLWKEIMIAKLKMGRDKDFTDWKAFIPYLKSKDSFNFNYKGFRHINYKSSSKTDISEKSKELSKLPNNQWFNRTIQPIINRFSKMFPNVRSVVISEKEIPNEVKSIVDGLDKQINSFFHKGQVYIIKEKVTKDIAIEEFLHPFVNALEQDNPELYKSLLLEAKKLFPELKEEVFTKYGKVYGSIFDLNREFLTQALTQKVSEQIPEQETFFQKFKTWIRDILDRLFGNEATTREISMLDETMSLTDLASILNENNTQFNFNRDTNTTYYSLNENEINGILNNLDTIDATNIQRQLTDKILENNKVTETDFTGDKHEYIRNELGETLQLIPVSNLLGKVKLDQTYEGYIELGNFVHDLAKSITNNTPEDFEKIVDNSSLQKYLMEEKGYPKETVDAFSKSIFNYINFLKQKGSILIPEVSISALQSGLPQDYKGIGGTIDLLEITREGKVVIHDFKSMYLDYKTIFSSSPKDILNTKFNYRKDGYSKQLSLYAKLLKGLVGNQIPIELQIVPIGYISSNTITESGANTFTAPLDNKGKVDLFSDARGIDNLVYSPIGKGLMEVDKKQFQVPYNKSFADKTIPSIEDKEEKKLSKEEIDRQELLNNLTDKIKGENSQAFEAEIEKVFKQVTTIVTQYGNSQNELNRELFKLFDPKGELKETKANFEAIFETIKEMGEDNPEKLKHYLSTLVQYINYIEETNVGLSNIKSHFYKIVANDANLDNQTLISDMRRSYLLAKSHKERINSILVQLGDIKEDNVFKQMLRKSTSYVDEIENLYFEKSLPLIANVLNSYFGKEFRDNMSKEIQDRLNKEKYDLNLATSDNAKIRINNKILKLEEQLKMIPNPNLIADIIQGKYGDSDWFYSNLMANINNPDYVISGTESFMTDIMRDLSLIAIKQEEEFARQFSKREDTLKVNRDQVKEMNKDLVYASNHLVKKADGTTEVLKSMTLLTEVNEDVYFDYEVLQDQLLKTEPNTPERKVIADKVKQFENEHFESEFNPRYLNALSSIDVVVSDGRNVKQVRQAILDKIKAIKVSNYKLNYLQGELESEEDLVELRELWREFMNLSSTIDRNGNKKTGADLEIADILQARKKELEEFRDKKVDEDLWKKLKAKKIQSLLGKYNTEEEVLKSEEYKKWQSFNSVISPTEEFYELRQSKLNAINLILDKKEYKDIPLASNLKDNLNQSWEKLLAISREYRDFEREIITDDIPEGTKQAMKILEENIEKAKGQIKSLEKSLSKEDKKNLNSLWEEYNSMIEYKTSKYYEEDFESALNQYALENGLEVSELRNDAALMTQFRLNNEWYINSHIFKERYDKLTGETIKYSEPVYYYKVVIPTDSSYIKESPASQYASFELKPEAYNLDEEGNPNYLDVFGRKKVKKSSKYITENIPYLKIKNDLSPKGRVNFENLEFLKKEMEEAQKGLNKQNYLYYQIPANRKSTFERVSEGDIKGVKQNLKDKFSINPQDETELGTRGVLANLSGEEAKFIPVLGKSKIDFNDQSYNIWKSILDYTLSAQKAKMFEEKLPVLDVLVDQLEKNLPAVDGNKNEAIGESMSKKFNLENVKEVIKGRGDKRVQAVKDTVARYVYEEFTKELANIGGISDIKLTNTLLGYSGATMMVGNIPNWIVNAMSGNIQLMIEAAGKRYFTSTDLKNAKIELAKRHKDAIADYTKTHDKSLFGQMVEYFDPVKGEFMDNLGNKFDWSKRTNLKQIFFSGKIYGEWEMQMTTFIAMLKAKKVTQIINGVEKTIDLYDAFEKGEDGIPKLKEGVQITDRELREYMTKIQGVNKLLNGSYAKLDQTKVEKYSLGRMAIFMKKFFIPLFVNRFMNLRGDAELQDVREGHYISFYNAIVKDMFNLPIGEIYAKMKKSPEDGGYTDLQKSAITKTIRELVFIAALSISLVMLGYDDDEDDSEAKKFAQYIALKLRREVATFTPVAAPQEFASFFSRPFAAMSSTGNLINLGGMVLKTPINVATGAFEDDLYYQRKTSMWDAGDSKFLALLYKSMGLKLNIAHPDQLLQGYNYSIRL